MQQRPMADIRQHDSILSMAPSRSDRVFTEQDLWYFKTREGNSIGPFRYKSEAEGNLDRFMSQLKEKLIQSR